MRVAQVKRKTAGVGALDKSFSWPLRSLSGLDSHCDWLDYRHCQ